MAAAQPLLRVHSHLFKKANKLKNEFQDSHIDAIRKSHTIYVQELEQINFIRWNTQVIKM